MSVTGKGGRPVGLPKTGGRKRGTPNKSSLAITEKLAFLGCDPVAVLAEICMDKKSPTDARIRCASELLSYLHPKRRPIEIPNSHESTCEIKTIVETSGPALADEGDKNGAQA